MARPIPVEIVDLSGAGVRVKSSRRLTPGLDVSVHCTTAALVVVVGGHVSRSRLVPLPHGHLGYDAWIEFEVPACATVATHAAALGLGDSGRQVLVGVVDQTPEALLALFDLSPL
jgi:hypothetical protein